MSYIDELSKLSENNAIPQQENESLLTKSKIPISHFEFEYIENCKNGKELEKILLVLRSGEEGYFPELESATENRLNVIKPRSKFLRNSTPVLNKNDLEKNDLETIFSDLNIWVSDVSKDDKELAKKKTTRTKQELAIRIPKNMNVFPEKTQDEKTRRIPSTDFAAWDQYDADTELQKIDLEDEKFKQKANKEEYYKSKLQNCLESSKTSVKAFSTEAERKFASNREREKGNEFFRNKEYEEALICYTSSIILKPNIDNLNNRAITYIKLSKYQEAIADCQTVLSLDSSNMKAHSRLAEALEKIHRYEEAIKHVDVVIRQDPNNTQAQQLAEGIRKNCTTSTKNVQMQILDV